MAKKPKNAGKPKDADQAQAGQIIQLTPRSNTPGTYDMGSQTVPRSLGQKWTRFWSTKHKVGIRVEYADGKKGEKVAMPNGSPIRFKIKIGANTFAGTLDDKGEALVTGFIETSVDITFPEIDKDEIKHKKMEGLT